MSTRYYQNEVSIQLQKLIDEVRNLSVALRLATDDEGVTRASNDKAQVLVRLITLARHYGRLPLVKSAKKVLLNHMSLYPHVVDLVNVSVVAGHTTTAPLIQPCSDVEDVVTEFIYVSPSGGRRLMNTPPTSPDQVNDKFVRTKTGQLADRFNELYTMTTPTAPGTDNWPRQCTFMVTMNECETNVGGGARATAETKQRRRMQVVVTAKKDDNVVLDPKMMEKAVAAIWKKMVLCNSYEQLATEQRIRLKDDPKPVDVAFAFDKEDQLNLVFGGTEDNVAGPSKKKPFKQGVRGRDAVEDAIDFTEIEAEEQALEDIIDLVSDEESPTAASRPRGTGDLRLPFEIPARGHEDTSPTVPSPPELNGGNRVSWARHRQRIIDGMPNNPREWCPLGGRCTNLRCPKNH